MPASKGPRQISPKGGPESPAYEIVFGGPYKGFDSDTSQWFIGPGGKFNDCSNVDFLKGQLITRPGMVTLVSDLAAAGSPAGQNYPNGTTPFGFAQRPTDATSFLSGSSYLNIFSPFWIYEATFSQLPVAPPTTWDRYQFKYTTSTASNVGTATITGDAGTNWTTERLVNGYFKHDADANTAWTRVQSVDSATQLTLVANYPTAHGAGSAYTIAIPIVEETTFGSGEWCSDSVGFFNQQTLRRSFVVTGAYGSRLVDSVGVSDLQTISGTVDVPRYKANCCAIYNGRMFLGTDQSAATLNATTYSTHQGRVAYSKNGNFSIFSTTTSATAGVFDIECSSVRWLIVLRDTLYAFAKEGIFAIQKTGNSLLPFRVQQVVRTNDWCTLYKPVSVDGAFVYLMGYDSLYRFDGSSIEKVASGADEWIMGNMFSPSISGYPGAMVYDRFRNRVVAVNPLAAGKPILIFDTEEKTWNRWSSGGTDLQTILLPWYNTASSVQRDEMITTVGTKLLSYRRTTTADDVPTASTAIAWSATTPVLDTQSSRYTKVANRVRLTYEVAGTSADNVTVNIYKDGGTTAATTNPTPLTIDTGGGTNGVMANGYVTFANINSPDFAIKLSGSSTKKVKINQVAIQLLDQMEEKPT